MLKFGERIRELRKSNKLTQRALAKIVDLDFSYISKIENDRLEHTPSINTIQRLAEALNADELELMQLANKVPTLLEPIVSSPEAKLFFQRATKSVKSSEGWKDLLDYLDERGV
jgi:transcriptional regulator with XRE-family HTH domain